jgi:hypothetical protein
VGHRRGGDPRHPAGITVTPISGLTVTEAGGTAQFSVVLDTAPTANVTIGLTSSDTTEGTLSASSLTFTPANWNVAQTVTVTGVDDSFIDGNVAFTVVTAAASSTDGNYNGRNASDVSLTNTDNDTFNTLVVDTAADTADGTTTSIAALMANKGADGKISLREAITAATTPPTARAGPTASASTSPRRWWAAPTPSRRPHPCPPSPTRWSSMAAPSPTMWSGALLSRSTAA